MNWLVEHTPGECRTPDPRRRRAGVALERLAESDERCIIRTCEGCDLFHKGKKMNKLNHLSKAMFCIRGKGKGRFIWWGHTADRIPNWCPKGLENTFMVAPMRRVETQVLYSHAESWGKE